MKKLIFVFGCLLCTNLSAILPPLYQTAEEIQAVLKGDQLGRSLPSGEPITEIRKVDQGYEVLTNKHRVFAKINYLPQKHPGPAQFKIEYSQVENR